MGLQTSALPNRERNLNGGADPHTAFMNASRAQAKLVQVTQYRWEKAFVRYGHYFHVGGLNVSSGVNDGSDDHGA